MLCEAKKDKDEIMPIVFFVLPAYGVWLNLSESHDKYAT